MIYILMIILAVIISFEFASLATYGKFIPKYIEEEFMNLNEAKLRLNQFDTSILLINNFCIYKVPFSLFSIYYVSNIGVVSRWSPLTKKIREYYKIAIKNSLK